MGAHMETRAETGDTYMHNSWAHKQQQPNTHRHTWAHKQQQPNTQRHSQTHAQTHTHKHTHKHTRAHTHVVCFVVVVVVGCAWLWLLAHLCFHFLVSDGVVA